MTDMTNRPLEIDQALEDWLGGGPRLSADQVVGRALTDVGATGQDRVSLFAIDVTVFRLGLVAAAVAALAIGLGLGIGPRLVGTEPSQASPTQEPSGPPSGSVLYTNNEDGYELTLPASWTPREMFSFDDPFGTMRFGAAYSFGSGSPFGALTVSIGSPDGTINVCAPMLCHQIVATTLDDLDDAVAGRAVGSGPMTETAVELTLDGEPARLERIEFGEGLILGGPQFHHLFAFHEGRPIILSFDVYAYGIGHEAVNDIAWVYGLIDGFHFLDEPTATVDPAPDQLLLYTNAVDGYELKLPNSWGEGSFSTPTRRAGITTFGRGDKVFLTVRVGDPNGVIYLCRRRATAMLPRCSDTTIRALHEFAGVLTSAPEQAQMPLHDVTEVQTDTILGGEPGMIERFDAGAYLSGPPAYYHVFTIHDGRPVVLSFEGWAVRRGEIPDLNAIVDSFRFLD